VRHVPRLARARGDRARRRARGRRAPRHARRPEPARRGRARRGVALEPRPRGVLERAARPGARRALDPLPRPGRRRPLRRAAWAVRAAGASEARDGPEGPPPVTYRPQEFWEQRLAEQFDLRGTGEAGLPLAYNRACYTLRADVLTRALERAGV